MKAEIRLLKYLGFNEAAELAHGLDSFSIHLPNDGWNNPTIINCVELKKYTDAYELVQSFNGVEMAKRFIDENIECNDSELLKQATTLVEEVGV